jgi:hypothetical protein
MRNKVKIIFSSWSLGLHIRLRLQLLAIGMLALGSVLSAVAAESQMLHIELRISKAAQLDADIRLAFGTDNGMEMAGMSNLVQKEDGDFRVFETSYQLKIRNPRRALIVYHHKPSKESDQVFVFSLPSDIKPTDWTDRKHPDFCETNAASNFRFEYVPADRSTNTPPNAFAMRYRIE